MRVEDLPIFTSNNFDLKISGMVGLIATAVSPEKWDNDKIDSAFAQRSAEQILADGHTFYMNPCLDYTLVMLELLKRNEVDAALVMEELRGEYPFNRVHFALEFSDGKTPRFIDFSHGMHVRYGIGEYRHHNSDLEQISIRRSPGGDIKPELPLHQSLGCNLLEHIDGYFVDFSLDVVIERLKQDNTEKNYEAFEQKHGDGLLLEWVK